eukprot:509733_1
MSMSCCVRRLLILLLIIVLSNTAIVEEFDGPEGYPILIIYATSNTSNPTNSPTKQPTLIPTRFPTKYPTQLPTTHPTHSPSKYPTISPTTRQPTLIPTALPTKYPTIKPTKFPTTKRPTKPPTVDEFAMLDNIIAETEKAKQKSIASKPNIIKLYAAESFYLMDELEKELLMQSDGDTFIVRNANKLSQFISNNNTFSYFDINDQVFHKLQDYMRVMINPEVLLDKHLLNDFILTSTYEISRVET